MTSSQTGSKRDIALIVLAGALGALVVLGLAWFFLIDNEETNQADGPTTTSSAPGGETTAATEDPDPADPADPTEPTESTLMKPQGGCPEGVAAEVCDAVAFVEEFKGQPFLTFPVVNFISKEEFSAFIMADFEENLDELASSGDELRSLGLIDGDLVEMMRDLLDSSVVGGYHTENEELNVLGTEINLYTRAVMVHELTHAWDDQYFELYRPELSDRDDEASSTFLQVAEGSASLVEYAWRDGRSEEEQRELSRLELSAVTAEDIQKLLSLPPYLISIQISPYVDGAAFVEAVYDDGGIDAVHALYDELPLSTEQILYPERFFTDEKPIDVPRPSPADARGGESPEGEIIGEGAVGALAVLHWLGEDSARGWGGDAYVSWRGPDGICTLINIIGDTPEDTATMLAAAQQWAQDAPRRIAASEGDLVVLQGCVDPLN